MRLSEAYFSKAFFDEVQHRYSSPAVFIEKLRGRMQKHEVSQADLARRSGFVPTHVSAWMNHRVKPSMETMVTLDEALENIIRGR